MPHCSVLAVSAAGPLICLAGLALVLGGCWCAYLVGRANGIGFRQPRLDSLTHGLWLNHTLWRVESSMAIAESGPELATLYFRQAGSRIVAVGEEADGRRRWFEGLATGHRVMLCEVSRVRRGFRVATLLLRRDERSNCLQGMRQVLLPDGSLQVQQISLTQTEAHPADAEEFEETESLPNAPRSRALQAVEA